MDIYLWLAVWYQSKQWDRCQVWLKQPYPSSAHREADTQRAVLTTQKILCWVKFVRLHWRGPA